MAESTLLSGARVRELLSFLVNQGQKPGLLDSKAVKQIIVHDDGMRELVKGLAEELRWAQERSRAAGFERGLTPDTYSWIAKADEVVNG